MSLSALAIFAFCSWAIFSHKFDEGLIVKHLFIFAAITAFLHVVDAYNRLTLVAAIIFLSAGLVGLTIRHRWITLNPKR